MELSRFARKHTSHFASPANDYLALTPTSPRQTNIRVHLLDKEFKTISCDSDARVSELILVMAKKMNITHPEYFGIFEEWTRQNKVERKLLSEDNFVFDKKRKNKKLVFKCKIFRELHILNADEFSTHLYYIQTRENIVTGYYNAPLHIALVLASTQMQIEFGPFLKEKHLPGFILPRISDYFPPHLLKANGASYLEKRLLETYETTEPKSLVYLKKSYCLEAMKLAVFGCRFFSARRKKTRSIPDKVLIGVKSSGIVLASEATKEFLRHWNFEKILRWGYTYTAFCLQLRSLKQSSEGSIWEFHTSQGQSISLLLNNYAKYILEDIEFLENKWELGAEEAAIRIQAFWRGCKLRKTLKKVKELLAAKVIANNWRM